MSLSPAQRRKILKQLKSALKRAQYKLVKFASSLNPEEYDTFWLTTTLGTTSPFLSPTQLVVTLEEKTIQWILFHDKTKTNLLVVLPEGSEAEIADVFQSIYNNPDIERKTNIMISPRVSFLASLEEGRTTVFDVMAEDMIERWQRENAVAEVRQSTEAIRTEVAGITDERIRSALQPTVQTLETAVRRMEVQEQKISELSHQVRRFEEIAQAPIDAREMSQMQQKLDTEYQLRFTKLEKDVQRIDQRIEGFEKTVNKRIDDVYAGKQVHLRKWQFYLVLITELISWGIVGVTIYTWLRGLGVPLPP